MRGGYDPKRREVREVPSPNYEIQKKAAQQRAQSKTLARFHARRLVDKARA
jgi:hypothetical protein